MNTDKAFAPCPFCGQSVGYITSIYGYRVVCDWCDIQGPCGRDYAEARTRWNKRAGDSQPETPPEVPDNKEER